MHDNMGLVENGVQVQNSNQLHLANEDPKYVLVIFLSLFFQLAWKSVMKQTTVLLSTTSRAASLLCSLSLGAFNITCLLFCSQLGFVPFNWLETSLSNYVVPETRRS